ncbi:MAG: hypothetical protein SWX82_25555 [Cyanobacteriota bacterium]|nr:hypothetical protein [Cyanobacteriota bacterium]
MNLPLLNLLEEGRRKKKEGRTEGLKKWMGIVNDRPFRVYKPLAIVNTL